MGQCDSVALGKSQAQFRLQRAFDMHMEFCLGHAPRMKDFIEDPYCAVSPPSITRGVPVTKDASSEARNSAP